MINKIVILMNLAFWLRVVGVVGLLLTILIWGVIVVHYQQHVLVSVDTVVCIVVVGIMLVLLVLSWVLARASARKALCYLDEKKVSIQNRGALLNFLMYDPDEVKKVLVTNILTSEILCVAEEPEFGDYLAVSSVGGHFKPL